MQAKNEETTPYIKPLVLKKEKKNEVLNIPLRKAINVFHIINTKRNRI